MKEKIGWIDARLAGLGMPVESLTTSSTPASTAGTTPTTTTALDYVG